MEIKHLYKIGCAKCVRITVLKMKFTVYSDAQCVAILGILLYLGDGIDTFKDQCCVLLSKPEIDVELRKCVYKIMKRCTLFLM